NAGHIDFRALGPRRGQGRRRVHGKAQARRVFLMAADTAAATAADRAAAADDIEAYLERHEAKGLLRFITCGSVDDGKSSLIGRLLYEAKMIFEDQFAILEDDSKRVGTRGGELDFALLVDGLAAE